MAQARVEFEIVKYNDECIYIILAFDFCRLCVVIRVFSSPPQRPMTTDFEGIPDLINYFLIFILEKEPVFPFSMLSA